MHEGQAVAFELLQDEALTPKEAGTDTLGEADANARAVRCAKKGILLADQSTANLRQIDGYHRTRIRCREGDPRLFVTGIAEVSHEQRLAGEHALAGAPQFAQQPTGRAVAHARLETHTVGHVVHRPGFGDHRLAGVEDDLH